jgi:hypothetical protein
MKITTQVKFSLDPSEETMLINAIKKGTHDFDDLITMINGFINDD